jgi:hypothetical protein
VEVYRNRKLHARMLTFQNFCQLEEYIDWTAALKSKEKKANLQRTQRPGIFSLGSEEGGAGRDNGADAGTGQKRAAPPSARDFAAMPAEKRARADHHGSGSVASDDAGATAHQDLCAALDVQGVERCESCGRDFTEWEPQQRPAQVWHGSRSLLHLY